MDGTDQGIGMERPAHADETACLRAIHAQATVIRAFEAKALALSRETPPRIAGSRHPCAGQEIVPPAAVAALRADGQIITTYRGHGWAPTAGLDPYAGFAKLCHRRDGMNGGRAGAAYLMAP